MKKTIYLAGYIGRIKLDGSRECETYMDAHATDKATVKSLAHGAELVFEDDKLVKAYEYTDGEKEDYSLDADEVGLAYREIKENRILIFKKNTKGVHQLGGEVPGDFQIPENNCVVPFQYLGYIDHQDENFNWLPFKLHLACPIYLNIGLVFLDYSTPHNPVIVNRDEVEQADTAYDDDLNQHSEIVYAETKFAFVESKKLPLVALAGIPKWTQQAEFPVCPKSGKTMKFVCQLRGGIPAKRTNVEPKDEWYRQYYEEMNFWGDGDLYIFFEPTSKVACYFIQNT